MSDKKTQILYAPDTRAWDELGANWHNIVNDIDEYLKSEGFSYSRTLGYVREGDSTREEIESIMRKIVDIGLSPEYFTALHGGVIENVIDVGDILRQAAEMEANGEKPDLKAMLMEAFGEDDDEDE